MAEITGINESNFYAFKELFSDNYAYDENSLLIGAIVDDTAVAVLGAKENEDGFLLNWMYTDSDYRNRGIASELIHTVHGLAKENHKNYFKCTFNNDNEGLKAVSGLLVKNGFFTEDDDLRIYSFALKDVNKKLLKEDSRYDATIIPVEDGNLISLKNLDKYSWQKLVDNVAAFNEKAGVEYMLEPKNFYNDELSFLYLSRDNSQVLGCFLVSGDENGLDINLMLDTNENNSKFAALHLIKAAFSKASKKYGADTRIRALALNEDVGKLIYKMTDGECRKSDPLKDYIAVY